MEELRIRPHARMLNTIGEGLIKDIPAAIVELVKNGYDADASFVSLKFSSFREQSEDFINIEIVDNGIGMSFEVIKKAWLVPSTDYKLKNLHSPSGKRRVQGQKGIGRYASGILGNKLTLESNHDGKKTTIYIDWEELTKHEYLEDVKIFAEETDTNESNGTKLNIVGSSEYLNLWTESEISKLEKELRKLMSPFNEDFRDDEFNITLSFKNFSNDNYQDYFNNIQIEPLPILNLYNYRLSGTISNKGIADLTFEDNTDNNIKKETIDPFKIPLDFEYQNYCGVVKIDLRVYDKDRENIIYLSDTLSKASNIAYSTNDIRSYLNEIAGAGIYRGGFRIRPHGDKGFDWLKLDNRRVQNPSKHIGLDQLVGFVSIEAEEKSNLIDKASRDGLKENKSYEGLIEFITSSLSKLEDRRFVLRQAKKSSESQTVSEKIESLFDFTEMDHFINTTLEGHFSDLDKGADNKKVKDKIYKDFNKQFRLIKKQKEKEYKEIKEIIAIYQGQATLGNIVTIILHEGRKNLSWFTNQIPRVSKWLKRYRKENNINSTLLDESIDRMNKAELETKALQNLFKKLDPLTLTRKSNKKEVSLDEIMGSIRDIFYKQLTENKITLNYDFSKAQTVYGHKEDFLVVFTNLVENSIYWLSKDESIQHKSILIHSYINEEMKIIDYKDSGPGIEDKYIEKESIFQPGFTTKSTGTGLGLAISGESIANNNGKLKALSSDNGVYFRIELK